MLNWVYFWQTSTRLWFICSIKMVMWIYKSLTTRILQVRPLHHLQNVLSATQDIHIYWSTWNKNDENHSFHHNMIRLQMMHSQDATFSCGWTQIRPRWVFSCIIPAWRAAHYDLFMGWKTFVATLELALKMERSAIDTNTVRRCRFVGDLVPEIVVRSRRWWYSPPQSTLERWGGGTVMVVKCLHRLHRGAEQRESAVLGGKRRGGGHRMKPPLCL